MINLTRNNAISASNPTLTFAEWLNEEVDYSGCPVVRRERVVGHFGSDVDDLLDCQLDYAAADADPLACLRELVWLLRGAAEAVEEIAVERAVYEGAAGTVTVDGVTARYDASWDNAVLVTAGRRREMEFLHGREPLVAASEILRKIIADRISQRAKRAARFAAKVGSRPPA